MHFPSYIVNKAVGTLVRPDAYIYFNISVRDSVKRQDIRAKEELRTKSEQVLSDVERFYKVFFSILEPEIPMYNVDASKSKDDVLKQVERILTREICLGITKRLK
jgi:thymidylate kinase